MRTSRLEVLNHDVGTFRKPPHESIITRVIHRHIVLLVRNVEYEYARPTFLLAHIDRYALLVARQATKPRARPVDIQFAPHAKRITTTWRFDFDNLGAEMPTDTVDNPRICPIRPHLSTRARVERKQEKKQRRTRATAL
jgi:hypothetical protein